MTICSTCGSQNPEGALFCDECGASLQSPKPQPVYPTPAPQVQPPPTAVSVPGTKNCPVCGAPAQPGGLFCESCGASLTSKVTQTPAESVTLPPTVAIPGTQAANVITAPEPTPVAAPLPPSSLTCLNCGAILETDSVFCDMCGAPVNKTSHTVDDVIQEPTAPDIPQSGLDINAGSEPTVVGGYAVPQDTIQPQVADYGTQQHFAATQVGNVGSQPSYGQPQTPNYDVQQTPGQQPVGYGAPASIQARFIIPGTNVSLPLTPGKYEYIIGREDPISNIFPEIDLTDHGGDTAGVSRQHARITLQGNQYYITDLQSTNYTFVNQQQLQPNLPTPLYKGDEIQLGRIKLIFSL